MKAVPVVLLLDVADDAEAADALNEILREQQRSFAPQSCLIDYTVSGDPTIVNLSPETYQEGDFVAPHSATTDEQYNIIGLLDEAQTRIADIQEAARDHEELGDLLALAIEDAAAMSDDIREALVKYTQKAASAGEHETFYIVDMSREGHPWVSTHLSAASATRVRYLLEPRRTAINERGEPSWRYMIERHCGAEDCRPDLHLRSLELQRQSQAALIWKPCRTPTKNRG